MAPEDPNEPDEESPLDALAHEFVGGLRRGERPEIEEYAARHPDLAGEIRSLFPALLLMEGLKPSTREVERAERRAARREQIGDYRIMREIGRGGMGVVYEAEQLSLGRRVALKVLPFVAADDPRAVERFQREARAAAMLHHTNIVPVFDVGVEGEDCYYAMQLIEGRGLDAVVGDLGRLRDENGLKSAEEISSTVSRGGPRIDPSSMALAAERPYWKSVARIGLQVAGALDHAHGRGIVHRDVKPSNLLLDASGVVWVADFGLAKTGEAGATLTNTGDVVGTLRYMSPERLAGTCDARADVYGLGATLYELLTLRPAFVAADQIELVRQVADDEPPAPRALDPRVPRDLETIVLEAMQKDERRRYASASELAEDLQRFLDDEPIRARPVSTVERLARWTRRNRAVAALLAGIVLLLVATSVGSAVAALRFRALADAAVTARGESEAVTTFIADMLSEVSQQRAGARGRDVTVREVLDEAARSVGTEFAGQPLIEARLRLVMGDVYQALDVYDAAREHLEAAGDLRSRALGPAHPSTLTARIERGSLYDAIGDPAAEEVLRGAVSEARAQGEDELVARGLAALAALLQKAGELDEAERASRESLALLERQKGPEDADTIASLHTLAHILEARADYGGAEELFAEVLARSRRRLGERHRLTGLTLSSLATLYMNTDRFDLAEEGFREALDILREVYGETHTEVAATINNIATLRFQQGDHAAAVPLFREAAATYTELVGEQHPIVLTILGNLGFALQSQGELDEAEEVTLRVLELRRSALGERHPHVGLGLLSLAALHQVRGNLTDAEALYAEAVDIVREGMPEDHWWIGMFLVHHGRTLTALGRLDEAESALREAFDLLQAGLGDDHERTREAATAMAALLDARDAAAPGEGHAEEAAQWRER